MKRKNEKIYIAGPMSAHPNYNREAFNEAAKKVKERGYEVFNPAQVSIASGSWGDYMRKDIAELMRCDKVVALPGWIASPGATIEHSLCRDLGIPWENLSDFLADQITDAEAERIVHSNQA